MAEGVVGGEGTRDYSLRDLEKPTLVMLWIASAGLFIYVFVYYIRLGLLGMDTHAYWSASQTAQPVYDGAPWTWNAYLYSPAFHQLVRPLGVLSWEAFRIVWLVLETLALGWLLAPLGWRWAVPALLLCAPEIAIGNVLGMLGVAVVLAVRFPGLWAVPALVKPAFGLGPIWYLSRGEWRKLLMTGLGTLTIVAVTVTLGGLDPWVAWLEFLSQHSGDSHGFLVRLPIAILTVVIAARLDRPWLLGPALLLATPVPGSSACLAILAVVPRLVSRRGAAGGDLDLNRPMAADSALSATR